ncbi:MAG TPA: tRNA uridine-5-carboxymethylaminomethyl(34) synthesis GTPase MnmE [Hyphomicrobium sp.]|nr:tRNA uridine-5-carboxymethylaminomethyl(34) synthesis GTPase MnmE [Hyphomicrobium sp.]
MPSASTIYALSSAPGRAGVAVVRVSGPLARHALAAMVRKPPGHGQAAFRIVRHPETGSPLDQALVLFFAGPNSETGEDVAEFQVHGGRAVVHAVLDALGGIPGCRLAEAGEFARRAFTNGKLDLAEVEGLADLVDAETEAQRVQALAQSSGVLSKLYEGWRGALLEAMALAEAAIDFSDESDVSEQAMAAARSGIAKLAGALESHLADDRRGEILREGFRVALLGAPNAGKSSLLNALARRDAAIVSEEAGTTRDVIEVRLDLGGYPVIVSDTAGLRDAGGAIEREGIRRSLAVAEHADLVLWLVEPGAGNRPPFGESRGESSKVSRETGPLVLTVHTKSDLVETDLDKAKSVTAPGPGCAISAKTGAGVEALVARITGIAADRLASRSGPPLTQARHRQALETCLADIRAFMAGDPAEAELRAEDLRRAAHALGRITGRVDVEDVLGQIFGRFCIGK